MSKATKKAAAKGAKALAAYKKAKAKQKADELQLAREYAAGLLDAEDRPESAEEAASWFRFDAPSWERDRQCRCH